MQRFHQELVPDRPSAIRHLKERKSLRGDDNVLTYSIQSFTYLVSFLYFSVVLKCSVQRSSSSIDLDESDGYDCRIQARYLRGFSAQADKMKIIANRRQMKYITT